MDRVTVWHHKFSKKRLLLADVRCNRREERIQVKDERLGSLPDATGTGQSVALMRPDGKHNPPIGILGQEAALVVSEHPDMPALHNTPDKVRIAISRRTNKALPIFLITQHTHLSSMPNEAH